MISRILAIYPHHLYWGGISNIFLSLCLPDFQNHLQIQGIAPSVAPDVERSNLTATLPRYARWLAYRLKKSRLIHECRAAQRLTSFDAVYLWPDVSLKVFHQAHAQGKPIFLERINCFAGTAKPILDEAYAKLKLPPTHPVTSDVVREELADAKLADFIFCPSPWVKASYLEAGIPEHKLLLSSYGWSTQRFPSLNEPTRNIPRSPDRPFTIIFMGSVCVRKGAHLLIDAFIRSGIKGKLVLCGQMEPVIQEVCKDALRRPDVIHHPFTHQVSQLYQNADLFAFPTLEEGSPLVSYEAMAHGLPMLVSPMGAGHIVRDRQEGIILPPYETDAWVEAIRTFAANPALQARLGQAARERAMDFTFDQVANRRANMMLQSLETRQKILQPI
jgi:glycosyltransferase involved in cell wall biosynthesis